MTRTPAITRTITPVVESTLTPSTSSVPDIAITNDPSVIYESCTANIIPPPPEPEISDAIIKPRLVYTNGYDTGLQQSFQREIIEGGSNFAQVGDLVEEVGWTYVKEGGENGGGYVLSIANTINPTLGQYSHVPMFSASNVDANFPNLIFGVPDNRISQAAQGIRINLFGKTLTQPMNVFALIGTSVFGKNPQVVLQILPDLTIRAVRVTNNNGAGTFTIVPIVTSTQKILASGWSKLSWQAGISAYSNPESGFVLAKRYIPGDTSKGVQLFKSVGINTQSSSDYDTINGWMWGTEVIVGAGPGLSGIGFDDVELHLNYGDVKRWTGNIYIDKTLPIADGDTIQSEIVHNGTHTRAEVGASIGPGDPVGANITHGQSSRYKNLSGVITDIDSRISETVQETFVLGTISGFTHDILDTAIANTPNVRSGADGLVYNTLYDGNLDLYKMSSPRADAKIIVGITPLLLAGNRRILFTFTGGPQWNGAATHLTISESGSLTSERDRNSSIEVIIKLDNVIQSVRYDFVHSILGNWGALRGYTITPYSTLITKADGITKFKIDDLIAIQVGARSSLNIINEAPDPSFYFQWNQFMLAQIQLEYAYLLADIIEEEHADFPPIPKLVQYGGTNLVAGHLVVRDASVSWDGTIVSRILDWNDGSSPISIAGSSRLNPADTVVWDFYQHNYAQSGIKSPFVTVIDNHGLTRAHSITINIPHRNPVANFSVVGASLAITFTDLSTGVLSTITGWHWDFGDGNTSSLQNPVHTYAIASTYPVSLTVTDNHSLTNTASSSLVVPIIVNSDCTMLDSGLVNQPFVQGDTFDGRNLPFTQYVNTAAFDVFYLGDTFREWYDTNYDFINDGISHSIDTIVKFNNHPTLKMEFGGIYRGAGWFSTLTDDGDPTEHYYNTIPYGSTDQWFGLILKAEAGIATDPALHDNSYFNGLELFSFGDSVFFFIGIRNGSVFIDIQSRITDGGSLTTVSFKLCDESELIGTAGFKQLCALYQSDNVAHTAHIAIWFGNACTLAGQSPNFTHDVVAYMSGGTGGSGFSHDRGLASDSLSFFNYVYNTPATPKSLWLAEAVSLPFSVSGNPFGVSLT